MDSQRGANWANIIGVFIGAALLCFAVWDRIPSQQAAESVGWGATVKGYAAPAIIALILLAAAVLQVIASRRRHPQPKSTADRSNTKPTVEIVSPFDNEEVGLYETVRGRVFPPNQELQIVIFAGDKWYPQRPVSVKGSNWSVQCQFGNPNIPSGGAYKVVALLGNELKGGMWYHELPTTILKSNIIRVHRPEVTIEDRLRGTLNERDEYKNQLQTATNAFNDMEERVETLTVEKTKLERDLGSAKDLKETAERSLEIEQRAKREVQSQVDTQLLEYKKYDAGLREQAEQIDALREKLQQSYVDAEQANERAKQANQKANYEATMQASATSRANDLEHQVAIWEPIIKQARDQAAQINEWVRMKGLIPGEILLRDRMVTFAIRILNESLYPISISPKDIKGSLSFRAARLKEEIDTQPDAPLIIDLEPRQPALIKLQQPLRGFEAEKIQEAHEISDSDGLFWFGNLYIPISAKNTPVPLIAMPLTIVEDYISINVTKFELKQAAPIALRLTRQELIAKIEALPPDKRAEAYAKAKIVYGENLENLE